MEYWYLTLCIFWIGVVFLLITKNNFQRKISSIFWFFAFATVLFPVLHVMYYGDKLEANTNFSFLLQHLQGVLDPCAAMFVLLISIAALFYMFFALFNKINNLKWNLSVYLSFIFFSAILFVTVQNVIYVFIAYALFNLAIYLFFASVDKDSLPDKLMAGLLYLSNFIFAIMIMIMCVFAKGFLFAEIAKSLGANINHSNDIFILIIISLYVPLIYNNKILKLTEKIKNEYYLELGLIRNLIFVLSAYCVMRIFSFGIVSAFWYQLLIVIVSFTGILFAMLKSFKARDVYSVKESLNITCNTLAFLGILSGAFGYMYGSVAVCITGFISAFLMLTNSLLADGLINIALNNVSDFEQLSGKLNRHSSCAVTIGLLSYIGAPLTLGFCAWVFYMLTIYSGMVSQSFQLRIIYYIIAFLSVPLFFSQIYNPVMILKNMYTKNSEGNITPVKLSLKKNIELIIPEALILLIGIAPILWLKFIFVPVSFFTGGTKFASIFQSVEQNSNIFTVYILSCILIIGLYILVKYCFLKFRN